MTGLFPDRETVEAGLRELEPTHDIERFDTTQPGLNESDWDAFLDRLLRSDVIITTG